MAARDRLLAWLVTGPVGRFVAFFVDFGGRGTRAFRICLATDWFIWNTAEVCASRARFNNPPFVSDDNESSASIIAFAVVSVTW